MMTKTEILDLMEKRGFTYNMESRNGDGKVIGYYFLSKPIRSRKVNDKILTPPYSCVIYPETDEFKFSYAVPKSINKLEQPKCEPFRNEAYFQRMKARFEKGVRALWDAFGEGEDVIFL